MPYTLDDMPYMDDSGRTGIEKKLLFIAFSSAMSRTIDNVYEARDRLLAQYPERTLTVVDTLSISGTMTQLVLGAHALYEEGRSMEEVAQWVLDNRMRSRNLGQYLYGKRTAVLTTIIASEIIVSYRNRLT